MKAAIEERSVAQYNTLKGFIAVERIAETQDGKGIIKPDIAIDKPQWANVVAVSECEDEIYVGDVVYISKFVPAEIEPFGDKIVVIHKTLVYFVPKRKVL